MCSLEVVVVVVVVFLLPFPFISCLLIPNRWRLSTAPSVGRQVRLFSYRYLGLHFILLEELLSLSAICYSIRFKHKGKLTADRVLKS